MSATPASVKALITARSRAYGKAFTDLAPADIMSFHSASTKFNDVGMDHFDMSHTKALEFFSKSLPAIRSMTILEENTSGTPEFTTWELLFEIEYGVDEPALGLKSGEKKRARFVAVMWWQWEGEGEWNGEVDEKAVKGWKIVREHDYLVVLKTGAKGEEEGVMNWQ